MRSIFRRPKLFPPCFRITLHAEAFRSFSFPSTQSKWSRDDTACRPLTAALERRPLRFASDHDNVDSSGSTIYALSTGPGRAAIAIIRVSGPSCIEIYDALCPNKKAPKPRYAAVRTLYEPTQPPSADSVLDANALVLFFPSPGTVTGEDVLELHVHGGPAIVKAVMAAISACPVSKSHVRYADAGEFTWRGFLNDRLDLTQVEALGDTLSAATEQQRKLSVRGTVGRLAKQYEEWRLQLLHARAELEALIDFQEDQNFDESPDVLAASVAVQVAALKKSIEIHISNAVRGELLRNGISIALLGAPNAGKSSLLNRIVGRDAAIVSAEAGTTRDVVEVGIDLGGYLCRLGDMAGLRSSTGTKSATTALASQTIGLVEEEGIRRAKQRALESDVVIAVTSVELDNQGQPFLKLDPEVVASANECITNGSNVVVIMNKIDRVPKNSREQQLAKWKSVVQENVVIPPNRVFAISCKDSSPISSAHTDSDNIRELLDGLLRVFDDMTSALTPAEHPSDSTPDLSIWQESLGASERHRLLLQHCSEHLRNFLSQLDADGDRQEHHVACNEDLDVVVAAESLRAAADCLARIVGRGDAGDVQDVLGVVFSKFCVGK